MRQRKCIISGITAPETELIRFVADDTGRVLVDVRAKAPGRGVWVGATRELVEQAIQKNAFARGLKIKTSVDVGLVDQVQNQLQALCLDLMGLARRSGQLVSGFEKVRSAVRNSKPGWLIEAKDGSADGRGKILALSKALWDGVPLVGCFDAAALGKALGRDQSTHVFMQSGAMATRLGLQIHRLSGFTPLIPVHWAQKDG